jgi:hypothetical protein
MTTEYLKRYLEKYNWIKLQWEMGMIDEEEYKKLLGELGPPEIDIEDLEPKDYEPKDYEPKD